MANTSANGGNPDLKQMHRDEIQRKNIKNARSSIAQLKEGMSQWIVANSQRTSSLEATAKTCDKVVDSSIGQCTRLREAERTQAENMKNVQKTLSAVEDQTKMLDDLDKMIDQIAKKTGKMADFSYFAPPKCFWPILFSLLGLCVVLLIAAYVLHDGLDIETIRLESVNLEQSPSGVVRLGQQPVVLPTEFENLK